MTETVPGAFASSFDSILFFGGLLLVVGLGAFLFWWLRAIKK